MEVKFHCMVLIRNPYHPNPTYEWNPWNCNTRGVVVTVFCPCQNEKQLLLRGTCSSSNLRGPNGADIYFSPRHTPTTFDKVFFESRKGFWDAIYVPFSRIDYDAKNSFWLHTSRLSKTIALSLAEEDTYILGKQNWTVRNDHQQCHLEIGKTTARS